MATKERTYTEAEIADKLRDLPGWYFEDGWIRRVYKTDGWPTTLMLVGAIGFVAEAAYHHLGANHGEAVDAQRGRDHRQGFRSRAQD
jgi:pterin-4a-carbinolamine dehydratase